jgi:hypothetical protein
MRWRRGAGGSSVSLHAHDHDDVSALANTRASHSLPSADNRTDGGSDDDSLATDRESLHHPSTRRWRP